MLFIAVIFIIRIVLPQMLFADPDTPYRHADAGWYQGFLDGTHTPIPVWACLLVIVLALAALGFGIWCVLKDARKHAKKA